MKLAIIQAAVLAAMFLIAAAVSYHSGYVGGTLGTDPKKSPFYRGLRGWAGKKEGAADGRPPFLSQRLSVGCRGYQLANV